MLRRLRKGQSTAEYAIVIGLVVAAAVAMQVYVKRGLQGKVKDAVDYNDPSATMLTGRQYEPDYQTTEAMVQTRDALETNQTLKGGGVVRTIVGEEKTTSSGTRRILGTN